MTATLRRKAAIDIIYIDTDVKDSVKLGDVVEVNGHEWRVIKLHSKEESNDRTTNQTYRVRDHRLSGGPLHSDVRRGESGVQDSSGAGGDIVATGVSGGVHTPDGKFFTVD